MTRRIVIIQGHPDPDECHLCHGLAAAYAEGAKRAGYAIAQFDLAKLEIPLLRSRAEFEQQPVPESLREVQQALLTADHVMLVFPLWLGTMPALVKAFLEQVMRPGTAFAYQEKGLPKKLLAGRSARLVVTMGMPALAYRWWYGAHGLKGLKRSILGFVGIRPVRETLFGMVATADEATRRRWLKRMHDLGCRGV